MDGQFDSISPLPWLLLAQARDRRRNMIIKSNETLQCEYLIKGFLSWDCVPEDSPRSSVRHRRGIVMTFTSSYHPVKNGFDSELRLCRRVPLLVFKTVVYTRRDSYLF